MSDSTSHGDIIRAIGRLEGKFDAHAAAIVATQVRQREDIEDQEKRLRSVEKWRTGVHYVAAAMVAIPGTIAAWFQLGGR